MTDNDVLNHIERTLGMLQIVWKLTPSIGRTAEQETIDQVLVLPSMQADLEGVFSCSVDGNNDLVKVRRVY